MLGKLAKIITSQAEGLYFGPKELDIYFPCYGAVMSLVSNLVKFHDCSIVLEIAAQFFSAQI